MGEWCPFSKGDCRKEKCRFWVHLLGKNPQGNETVDKFDCTFVFLPILLVENAQMGRQTSAAIESFRNEMANPKGIMGLLAAQFDRFNTLAEQKMLEAKQ